MKLPLVSLVALGLLVAGVSLAPVAAAQDPVSGAVHTVGGVVVCELAGLDAAVSKTIGDSGTGYYPGRPGVETAIDALRPDGSVGRPVTDVGRNAGTVFTSTYDYATGTAQDAEDTGAAVVGTVVQALEPGYEIGAGLAKTIKCLVAAIVVAQWDAQVKPHLNCWYFGGGPGYAWFWSDVAPYPTRPLPTGRLPPCV